MASAIGHLAVGAAIGFATRAPDTRRRAIWLCAIAAWLPDADYLLESELGSASLWAHRGLTHSWLVQTAAVVLGIALTGLWRPDKYRNATRFALGIWLALCSHSWLDAMTDGEPGVALWSPVDVTRYFLGWRPIPVSPDSVAPFFGEWGLRVLRVELWFALAAWIAASAVVRMRRSA